MFEGVGEYARKSWLNSVLVLIALVIAGFSISSFIALLFIEVFFDLPLITDPDSFNQIFCSENTGALKFMQVMNQLGMFGGPGFAFMWLIKAGKGKANSATGWILAVLVPICALPLITWLSHVPESLSLLDDVIDWMKANQANADELYEKLLVMDGPGDLVINLLVMSLIPAVSEEVLFRGGLQQMIQKRSGKAHLAIWVTAIIFSLIHFQFLTFIPRVVMGAGLGYLFYWGGSLWVPIVAHAVNNGVAVLAVYFLEDDPRLEEFENIATTFDIWVVVSIAATAGLFLFLNRAKQPDS